MTRIVRCDECESSVNIDDDFFDKPLVSACIWGVDITQRTARCGSVRKPVTYQGKPGRPECWRVGNTERIEESAKASTALETAERPRREAQSRGAGQPEARTRLLEQGPSNSYFGGPYFISLEFVRDRKTGTEAAGRWSLVAGRWSLMVMLRPTI